MKKINLGGVTTPLGFQSSAICTDIKGNNSAKKDFGLLVSDVPATVSATFTKNRVKAAPVIYDMNLLSEKDEFFGIVINSGNANACTGNQGLKNTETICQAFENKLQLDNKSLLMASTGVIGVQLPVDKMLNYVDEIVDELDDTDNNLAEAILTTDTVVKKSAYLVETGNGAFVVGGIAKGAGMIAPDMATMLAFITTDALVDKNIQDEVLRLAVEDSFNSITVDGDMSTNDSVFLFSNGMSGISVNHSKNLELFKEALKAVCLDLAKMIVKDGEGATKFVSINIKNAKNYEDAKKCAFKIANSPLCKTMFFGSDPNWGRLMATIGSAMIEFEENKVDIFFDDLKYVENGLLISDDLEDKAYEIMKKDSFVITIDLKAGNANKTVYTCDLSYDYVKINADYRT
ncbi:arginine biosynthesis bifunctional protein ArgJ [Deferribacter desulfuricans SSM1]|uniref:Arginine biosynthesis bifunctional protein ArgJ n=1 Tax=Deferribacter desulfuricans (strain DSM 14783 / JCM 11476 / NBRC 101012 / SSM1) TaxID=639282 RepID=D3P9R5_DEFDS|nr:bifunctional glutamate N-acetyltransferase/amino-acid acetyltransferase ArgJ [Deferribacter desulfuricans]BAI81455.1 arginine biosynthesis bifunctional protein ArgJ [Deferribacter desulfuricans SSM1]